MTQKRGLGRGLSDLGLNELLSEISNASPPLSMGCSRHPTQHVYLCG